jgi:hypothetical protein
VYLTFARRSSRIREKLLLVRVEPYRPVLSAFDKKEAIFSAPNNAQITWAKTGARIDVRPKFFPVKAIETVAACQPDYATGVLVHAQYFPTVQTVGYREVAHVVQHLLAQKRACRNENASYYPEQPVDGERLKPYGIQQEETYGFQMKH